MLAHLAKTAVEHKDAKDGETANTYITIGKDPENLPGPQAIMMMIMVMIMLNMLIMAITIVQMIKLSY